MDWQTSSGTLSGNVQIVKGAATLELGNLNQTYEGVSKPITYTTTPLGLNVVVTYTGTSSTTYGPTQTAPVNAGSYAVTAAIDEINYQGTATGTLTIAKATATLVLGNLDQVYNGGTRPVTHTVTPSGLTVVVTYTGASETTYGPTQTAPTDAGQYTVNASIDEVNYQGTASGPLVIAAATTTIAPSSSASSLTYGESIAITATIAPAAAVGTVRFFKNGAPWGDAQTPVSGSASLITNTLPAGTYVISATFSGSLNWQTSTGTLATQVQVSQATAGLALGNLTQAYTGASRPVTSTTTPLGLTVVDGESFQRNLPVSDCGARAMSSGVPSATISPPAAPPSGPRSTIQSAARITSTLCSTTTTVLPASTNCCSKTSSLAVSATCSPVVGSSSR